MRKFSIFNFAYSAEAASAAKAGQFSNGFGLLEIVIVVAIVSGVFFALAQVGILSVRLLRNEKENLQATLLAVEGLEAVRAVRDESWDARIAGLTNATPYYPIVENGRWVLTATSPGAIDGLFTREVILDSVYRDSQDRIASSGTLDPDTRKVTTRITWTSRGAGRTRSLTTYLTNFAESLFSASESIAVAFDTPATDADLANFPSANTGDGDPTQSFTTPAQALAVTKTELLLRRATAIPSDLYLEIRTSSTGSVRGTSQIVTGSTIASSSSAWVGFRFLPAIVLAASTSYTIRLRSQPDSTQVGSGSQGVVHWIYQQSSPSPYAGGEARRYVGRLGNPSDTGQLLDQYDFGFRVYTK